MIEIWIALFWAVASAGSLWFLVVAFKKSAGWGFAVLLIPFVSLYFAFKFWNDVKKPLFVSLSASAAAMLLLVSTLFNAPASEITARPGSIQLARKTPPVSAPAKKTLTDKEEHGLIALEKTIEMIEKLPKDEKQQQFLSVMKKQVNFKRSVFSDSELGEFKKEVEAILKRTDLNKNQRGDFEALIEEIQKEAMPDTAPSGSPVPKIQTAAIQPDPQNLPVHAPGTAILQEERLIPDASKIEKKATAWIEETPQGSKRPRYKRISFAQAKKHVGSPIAFKGPRGRAQKCVLIRVKDQKIHCRKYFADGTFSFSYQQREIKALKVLPQ